MNASKALAPPVLQDSVGATLEVPDTAGSIEDAKESRIGACNFGILLPVTTRPPTEQKGTSVCIGGSVLKKRPLGAGRLITPHTSPAWKPHITQCISTSYSHPCRLVPAGRSHELSEPTSTAPRFLIELNDLRAMQLIPPWNDYA